MMTSMFYYTVRHPLMKKNCLLNPLKPVFSDVPDISLNGRPITRYFVLAGFCKYKKIIYKVSAGHGSIDNSSVQQADTWSIFPGHLQYHWPYTNPHLDGQITSTCKIDIFLYSCLPLPFKWYCCLYLCIIFDHA